jgi:hypothetical protein
MSRALTCILFCGLLVSIAAAQDTATGRKQPSQESPPSLTAQPVSPYLIEWFLDINEDTDLRDIWRLLKTDIPKDISYNCGGGCTAETFEIDMADKSLGKTVALAISFPSEQFYQFLIFRRTNDSSGKEEWKLIGNIDSIYQKYGAPKHRIESGDDRTWLVVRELWGSGTQVLAYGDVWYEIGDSKVRRVLSYPIQGHYLPCQSLPGRAYKSLLLRHGLENGAYTVPIQFLISYHISDCGNAAPPLFARSLKATFIWDSAKEQFILDLARSDITERAIASISDGSGHERFIEDNFDDLSKIAGGVDSVKKEWLKRFLTGVPDGRFKTALQQAFK